MMNEEADQQEISFNSPIHTTEIEITEETPLTNQQLDGEVQIQPIIPWSTCIVSQICREGDLVHLRSFTDFIQQTTSCAKYAAEITDRLDVETGLSPLHHAARYQQLHICLMLLSNIEFQFGVNIKDTNDRTPIHSAFRSSNNINTNHFNPEKQFDMNKDFGNQIQDVNAWQEEYKTKILSSDHPLIYLFAKVNGNLNARDKYLLTPLHYAVARNNLPGVKQLITLKADIEPRDRQGIRPLHLACKDGYLSIVQYLIERGAQIDVMDADQWTPLHYACAKGYFDIIQVIKSSDARNFRKLIQMKTTTNASCLYLAVQHGNTEIVEYILLEFNNEVSKILVNEQVEPFGTPLHIAAKLCDSSMINLLYHHGADPLILNSHHQSSLYIASASNRLAIVHELLSLTHLSLLEVKDDRGQTALSVTTDTDIIDELLTVGADVSSLDNNDMNVLMIAASKNRISIVEHLLFAIDEQSISIFDQVTKRNSRSIFLLAVQTGSIRLCSLLLTHPSIRWDPIDKNRMNAFHIAAQKNHSELIEFLCNHIQKSDQFTSLRSHNYSLTTTITNSDLRNVSLSPPILRLYLDAQNEDGKTPLHFAAEQDHRLCVEILLKYGADVLVLNYLGQLALHTAIQHGHSQCVQLLIQTSIKNLADFQSVLARKQSPLLTACQNGFVHIVRLLLSQGIGLDYNDNQEKNPLEIAIQYRQIPTVYELLEHSHMKRWLMSTKKSNQYLRQTPLREMIRYIPQCAKYVFDKLIIKTNEIDFHGNTFERITYDYRYIDDYFLNNDKLYAEKSHELYRNHPFIIALDTEHHFLLDHPLARQLMKHKWKLYRPLFYSTLILTFLLLLIVTFYVLIIPVPTIKSSPNIPILSVHRFLLPIQWTIVILAGINLLKILFEILLYRGLRVPFAQIFGILSYLTSIIAFLPYPKTNEIVHWQWQLAACSTLCQWFNMALILRSVPFIGTFIVMFQSILINCISLIIVILPLLMAFTLSIHMIFYNHSSFLTILISIHKLSAMVIGEFDYESLFYSKPIFPIAIAIFIPFIFIMTIVFMNLLLGLTVGDIQSSMENARAKANAYRIRELIYIESTLPSLTWFKSNILDKQIIAYYPKDLIQMKTNEQNDDDVDYHQHASELGKSLDILQMLCTQSKQVLQEEIHFERTLKRLFQTSQTHLSLTD